MVEFPPQSRSLPPHSQGDKIRGVGAQQLHGWSLISNLKACAAFRRGVFFFACASTVVHRGVFPVQEEQTIQVNRFWFSVVVVFFFFFGLQGTL